jgi:hypothetical protein
MNKVQGRRTIQNERAIKNGTTTQVFFRYEQIRGHPSSVYFLFLVQCLDAHIMSTRTHKPLVTNPRTPDAFAQYGDVSNAEYYNDLIFHNKPAFMEGTHD